MIKKLTEEQSAKVKEYRERYFNQATSVEPADRCRSEAAGRRLAEIAGVRCESVHWVASPQEGASLWESLRSSLRASLSDSLWASLRSSLWDSLWASLRSSLLASLWDSLMDSLSDSLSASLRSSLCDSLLASLRSSLLDSLRALLSALLWDSLMASLSDSLRDLLRDSLRDSLRASLRASLSASLRESIRDSLWDTGWLAYYSYAVEVLGIDIDDQTRELLYLHNEIAASCFVLWVIPGAVILCERPERVDIKEESLVDIKWRK